MSGTEKTMADGENADPAEKIRALEARVEKLEKQLALLSRAKKPAPGAARGYRDSFDALDYPER